MTTEQIEAKRESVAGIPDARPVAITAGELRALCDAALGTPHEDK